MCVCVSARAYMWASRLVASICNIQYQLYDITYIHKQQPKADPLSSTREATDFRVEASAGEYPEDA